MSRFEKMLTVSKRGIGMGRFMVWEKLGCIPRVWHFWAIR